ncbi:MAG: tetratricopeptide repeat protein [Sterolibacteriaceae bacterium]|nr:tetratricopeptide repeat protein [Sterolibacteriaceae bacterium]
MNRKDELGNAVSGASAAAVEIYQRALHEFQCYIGDPVATIDEALAASPDFVMAHAIRAYLHLVGTEPAALPVARAAYEAARKLPANPRERAHLDAVGHLLDGEWQAAARVLEDLAIDFPHDALALQAGHLVDFYSGAGRMLRDRIARALPQWSENMPGYHALLGMHAFGLEETGHYDRAEAAGKRALEMEPRDSWAWHAVTHVMEMQGRQREGIAWLRADTEAWSRECFFRVHIWWHLALFHLDLDEVGEVLALYDDPIYGERSPLVLDMVDASAVLWRMHLRGIELGDRWQPVADAWEPVAAAGAYAFNDAHAMMAFASAGRPKAAQRVLDAQERALRGPGDNALFTGAVGAAVTRAIKAFGDGDYGQCVRRLRPVRDIAQRFGGSHAQRDVIGLTLIEAALRDGQFPLARALAAERIDLKPTSPAGNALLQRANAQMLARAV